VTPNAPARPARPASLDDVRPVPQPRCVKFPSAVLALVAALPAAFPRLLRADPPEAPPGNRVFDVRDRGAVGDGRASDTAAVQSALDAVAAVGGGVVRIPAGTYLIGSLRLPSHLTLKIEPGARLLGTTNLAEYRQPTPPADLPEAKWGKWLRGLLIAENAEDITITGGGIIDGNKVFDPTGEERMRGPHGIVFSACRGFTIRDVTVRDAANYGVYFMVSDDVVVDRATFIGGWDGVHWRGSPSRWCRNVRITQCRFHTGDDSIAGRYWDNTLIAGCTIHSSCNGIRLIGPATRLIIHDCLFHGPGDEPHRTSGARRRTNMLAAINLQPGAWDATQGPLDDVLISDVTIHDVTTPFHFVTKPGNTAGRITVERASVTGAYLAAASIESWAETPIDHVVFRDVSLEFTGGGSPGTNASPDSVKGPGVDARPLPPWGLYARRVNHLTLENVRVSATRADRRPVFLADQVGRLDLDGFRFPRFPEAPEVLVWRDVGTVAWPDAGERTHWVTRPTVPQR